LLLPIKKGMHYLLGAFAGIRMGWMVAKYPAQETMLNS
jgi:hypothetical protein